MIRKFITPKKGLLVRGPDGSPLPETGANKPYSAFWRRRLKDGDVTITKEKTAKAPAKAPTNKGSESK